MSVAKCMIYVLVEYLRNIGLPKTAVMIRNLWHLVTNVDYSPFQGGVPLLANFYTNISQAPERNRLCCHSDSRGYEYIPLSFESKFVIGFRALVSGKLKFDCIDVCNL